MIDYIVIFITGVCVGIALSMIASLHDDYMQINNEHEFTPNGRWRMK